jgi:excisionase family DNA binding protein
MAIPLLTPEEAAEMLHMKPQTVRAYLRKGKIRGLQVAGRWMLTHEAFDAFVRDMENARLNHGAA